MSGANLLVLALPTLLLPIFSRLYSVSDFAQFGLYTNILSLILPFVSLHYQQAIPVPQNRRSIQALTQLCFVLAVVVIGIVSLCWFFVPAFADLLDPEGYLALWPWVLPVGLVLTAYIQIMQHWILQGGVFQRFATSKSALAVSQSTYRYTLGAGNWFSGGLIWSYLLALVTQILVFGRAFKPGNFAGWKSLRDAAVSFRSYLIFGLPGSLLLSAANFLPLIILAHFFAEEYVGQYSMALRLGTIPIFLLATAFGQVYFADCKKEPEKVAAITAAFLQKNFRLTGVVVSLAFFIAKPVGIWVIGAEWELAVAMVMLLLPALWLNFMVLPLTHLFELKNRQQQGFYYSIWCVVLRLLPLALVVMLHPEIHTAVVALGLGSFLSNGVGFYFAQKLSGCSIFKVLKTNWLWVLLPVICGILHFMFLV